MKDEDKHELEYRWTFWIDQSSKDKDKYQEDLHNLGTVDSVEDFWICWSAILNHKNLPPQHTLCMFKEGIKPTWEDPQNRDGGRWSIYVQPQIFAYAKRIVNCIFLSVIGCQVEPTDKICGVVVRKRDYGITVDIWSKDISQSPDLSKEVSQKIDAILKAEFGAQVSEDNAIRPTAYNNHPDNAPQLVQAQQSPHGKKRRNQNRRDNNSHARSQHNMSPHSFLYAPSSPHSGSNSGSSSSNGNGSANSVNSVNSLSDFSVNSTLTSSPSNSAMVEPSPPIILGTHKGAKRNISIESDSDSTINNDDDVDDDDDSSVDVTRKNGSSSSLTPWMAIHKKSASESITDDSQKGGTEKALPILLKKGFDIPTSAYFDIAQKKIDASKPHDNEGSGNGNISEKRKIRCRASVGGGSMPPKFVLDHRRAYSLDKSSEDAYSKYVKTKQGAEKISFEGLSFYTPPRTSSPEDTPLVFAASENSDLPIPGIPSAFPGIGIPGMDGNVSGGRVNDGFNNTVNISGVGNDDDDDWLKQNGSNADTKKFAKRHRSSGLCVVTDISHDDEEEDNDDEEGNENEKDDVNENVDVEDDKNKQNGNKDVIVGRENKKEEEKTKEKKKGSDNNNNNSTIKKPDTVEPAVKQKETNKNGLRKRKSSGKHAEDKKEATPVPAATKDTQEESKNKSKGKQERIITLEEYKRNAFILLASIIICAMTMIIILLFISAHFFING